MHTDTNGFNIIEKYKKDCLMKGTLGDLHHGDVSSLMSVVTVQPNKQFRVKLKS